MSAGVGWSYDGVAHTFGFRDWDMVGSYGLTCRAASGPAEWPFEHFDPQAFRARPMTATAVSQALTLRRGEPLLPVDSCFGGLGAYRMECFEVGEYGGASGEHLGFHERIRRAGLGRIFLNSSQITLRAPF